jgi:hypothetical protein
MRQITQQVVKQPDVVSGFLLNTGLRGTSYRYDCKAVEQIKSVSGANLYKPKWVVVPDDLNMPIPGYDTYEYQARVEPGSILWGIQFTQFQVAIQQPLFVPIQATGALIQVTDACTGIELFSEFAVGAGFSFFNNLNYARNWCVVPHVLTEKRIILEPGLLNVEIANRTTVVIYCQLILFFSEPCLLIEETREGVRFGRVA